jgi:hypothetical protein
MAAKKVREAIGIFGEGAWKWRGSILRLALDGGRPFYAKLREVRNGTAELEVLDADNLRAVIAQRIVDWPPPVDDEVKVIRTAA